MNSTKQNTTEHTDTKRYELDAACALFACSLRAYKRGELARLEAERAWSRMAGKSYRGNK